MNGSIPTDSVIAALAVMAEARREFATSPERRHHQLAERIAIAEGRLRGCVMQALPESVELRNAA